MIPHPSRQPAEVVLATRRTAGRARSAITVVAAVVLLAGGTAFAQTPSSQSAAVSPGAPSSAPADETPQSLLSILAAGGPVGLVIVLLSLGAVALVVEHLWTIRAPVLMPEGLGDKVRDLLKAGQRAQAEHQCKLHPSFLAYVLQAGIAEIDGGWSAVEKALEDATAEQSARMFRKIEYLSVIGNIAPMLGLLGTVIGMIVAFREVATTQGVARAADLAEGIYLALVTTVEGLIVAIPSLAAFAVFRSRVDQLTAEAAYMAQHVFTPLRRTRSGGGRAPAGPPPPGGER